MNFTTHSEPISKSALEDFLMSLDCFVKALYVLSYVFASKFRKALQAVFISISKSALGNFLCLCINFESALGECENLRKIL